MTTLWETICFLICAVICLYGYSTYIVWQKGIQFIVDEIFLVLLPESKNYFLLFQIMNCLEANENPRPMTIRTNTLKTRRRELGPVSIQLRKVVSG